MSQIIIIIRFNLKKAFVVTFASFIKSNDHRQSSRTVVWGALLFYLTSKNGKWLLLLLLHIVHLSDVIRGQTD